MRLLRSAHFRGGLVAALVAWAGPGCGSLLGVDWDVHLADDASASGDVAVDSEHDGATGESTTPDTSAADTSAADTSSADTSTTDTGPADTGTHDSTAPDSGQPDTSTLDTSIPDAGAVDSNQSESSVPDATTDGGCTTGCGGPPKVVMFGGYGASSVLADTWTFDGATWAQIGGAGPPPRYGAAMAPLGHKLVLFGGTSAFGGPYLNDTWIFDGATWTQITPALSPPAASGYVAMTSWNNKVVLVDGVATHTWTFDGTTWTELTTPTAPYANTVSSGFVTTSSEMVYFAAPAVSSTQNNTWSFNGASWTQITAAGPSYSGTNQFAPIAALGSKVICFGARPSAAVYLQTTWSFDGTSWSTLSTSTPPVGRAESPMATLGNKVVLFGGYNSTGPGGSVNLSDTWTFDGTTWTQVSAAGPPAARYSHAMATLTP